MTSRPLEAADFPAVVALYNATSATEVEGGPVDERAFMLEHWQPPPPWIMEGVAHVKQARLAGALLARRAAGYEALRVTRLVAPAPRPATLLAHEALALARRLGLHAVEAPGASGVERAAFSAAGFAVESESVELRAPVPARLEAPAGFDVAPLDPSAVADAAALVTEAFAGPGRPATTPDALANLALQGPALAGRDASGRVVAFVSLRPSAAEAGVGEIHDVAVAADARGRGWGRAIVVAALREARALGFREAWLATGADNQPALALYASLGFREARRVPGFVKRVEPSGRGA